MCNGDFFKRVLKKINYPKFDNRWKQKKKHDREKNKNNN